MKSSTSMIRKWLFEYDLFMLTVLVLSTGFVNKVLSKWQTIRTFYPADASLWNVYSGDTVTSLVVFLILYFILAPLIYFSERHRLNLVENPTLSPSSPEQRLRRHSKALRVAIGLLCSTMWAVLLIETGKGYVGRLRPYFARICYGNDFTSMFTPPSSSDSTADWSSTMTKSITSDTQCPTFSLPSTAAATEDDDFDIKEELHDARRSFPSGHATLAVSGAAYGQLVLIRLARTPRLSNEMGAIVMFVGWLWLLFSAWVSASRVVDNAHHVGDVAVGAFIGLWCAAMHYWYVAGRTEAEGRSVTDDSEATRLGKRVESSGSVKTE